MPAKKNGHEVNGKRVVSSSGGTDAEGRPVITPVSVLRCVDEADGSEFQTLAVDTVRLTMNPLWSHEWTRVALPIPRLFDHVPISPALLRHWLRSASGDLGGLVFPGSHMRMTSPEPRLQIQKSDRTAAVVSGPPFVGSLLVDLELQVFRRDLSAPDVGEGLPPYDPSIWHRESYERWSVMHARLAPIVEEEARGYEAALPSGACALFRRMMRVHFNDAALIFGQMWWSFGLRELAGCESLHDFMRGMLMHMFTAYYVHQGSPTKALRASLPPSFDAVTVAPAQRVCAKCLLFVLGSGRMLRCPCHKVYYCSKACQLSDWGVHRVLCTVAAARAAARATTSSPPSSSSSVVLP
jgi:hypothetical protein